MFVAKTLLACAITCVITFLGVKKIHDLGASRLTVDASNLRQIAASVLIASSHEDFKIPAAKSVTDFAILLARDGMLNDAFFWVRFLDPARSSNSSTGSWMFVVDRKTSEPTPEFLALKLSVAVPILPPGVNSPPTMPIAWTRGLQRDGHWAKHAPYGDRGGHIAFVSGPTRFYADLRDAPLRRFDGKGYTSDILEALPPGASVSEYEPTDAEKNEWSQAKRPKLWLYLLTDRIQESAIALVAYAALAGFVGLLRLSRLLNQESFKAWLIGSAIPLGMLFLLTI